MVLAVEPVGTWGTPVASSSAATSYTITGVTVPAGAKALVVGIGFQGTGNPSSVVWDAATLNEALTLAVTADDGAVQAVLYVKFNPTAASNKSITLTWGTNRSAVGAACTIWANVDTTAVGSTAIAATNGTPSLTIATVPHGIAIDYLASAANPTLGPSQNSYHDGAPGGANMTNADGSYEFPVSLPDSQPIMSWVLSNFYVQVALALSPAVPALPQDDGSLRVPNHFHLFAATNR